MFCLRISPLALNATVLIQSLKSTSKNMLITRLFRYSETDMKSNNLARLAIVQLVDREAKSDLSSGRHSTSKSEQNKQLSSQVSLMKAV